MSPALKQNVPCHQVWAMVSPQAVFLAPTDLNGWCSLTVGSDIRWGMEGMFEQGLLLANVSYSLLSMN